MSLLQLKRQSALIMLGIALTMVVDVFVQGIIYLLAGSATRLEILELAVQVGIEAILFGLSMNSAMKLYAILPKALFLFPIWNPKEP